MKKSLIIKASSDIKASSVLDIKSHLDCYRIENECFNVSSFEELRAKLKEKKCDYLYFVGHGNERCFGNNEGFSLSWDAIGDLICETNCLNNDAKLMLYCCQGGRNIVANLLFSSCKGIRYICGAKQDVTSVSLGVGFDVILYDIENQSKDPVISAQHATSVTKINFECFDKMETEAHTIHL